MFVPLPKNISPEHPLAELIGLDSLGKLAVEIGGEMFPVPRCLAAMQGLRDSMIRNEYYLDGLSQRKLAIKYNLTERRIRSIAWLLGSLACRSRLRRQQKTQSRISTKI